MKSSRVTPRKTSNALILVSLFLLIVSAGTASIQAEETDGTDTEVTVSGDSTDLSTYWNHEALLLRHRNGLSPKAWKETWEGMPARNQAVAVQFSELRTAVNQQTMQVILTIAGNAAAAIGLLMYGLIRLKKDRNDI